MINLDLASFRDPDGFIFYRNNEIFRQVNLSYKATWQKLEQSGFLNKVIADGLLVSHRDAGVENAFDGSSALKVLSPERILFISYPYEWSFEQLKAAALLTLELQLRSIRSGFSLKDATAFNVQFHKGRPVWIDTLSFEIYNPEEPWAAYRQFCRHFLAPLSLMAVNYLDCNQWMRTYLDGIPLELASRMLSWKSYFNPGLLMHLHMHSWSEKKFSSNENAISAQKKSQMSALKMEAILDSLKSTITNIKLPSAKTEWGDYYQATNYSDEALLSKEKWIRQILVQEKPESVWDLGANNGRFSRIASGLQIPTVAFDIDPIAVNKNYLDVQSRSDPFLLPLVMDLTNPSPSIGWANAERKGVVERAGVDILLALALIHHLAISNNVPLGHIAQFFSQCGKNVIVEFIPKEDSQVVKMLKTRKDIFNQYDQNSFEESFGRFFETQAKFDIPGTQRTLYFLTRKNPKP